MCYNEGMYKERSGKGFTLIEVLVGVAIFTIFALGIYGTLQMVYRAIYQSRLDILETALLSEQLEIARNLPYNSIGIINGIPSGVLPHSTTTIRNGVTFNLITTVRNIDDPFDGTLGGIPNDTAPADYKIIEMTAQCVNCNQQKPLILTSMVGPKNLEGSTNNGALFLNVFDANGLPVVGANVHIVNTSIVPNIIVDDVTGNDGYLRIVDTPTATMGYNITVSKPGYSTDNTVSPSVANPNPVKPPANVSSQTVTNLSFAIDKLGAFTASTIYTYCSAFSNASFNMTGTKLIGTAPTVYKFDKTIQTDANGNYTQNNVEWDTFQVSAADLNYDIAGTIPQFPFQFRSVATSQ